MDALLVRVVEASGKTQQDESAWGSSASAHLSVAGAFVKGDCVRDEGAASGRLADLLAVSHVARPPPTRPGALAPP